MMDMLDSDCREMKLVCLYYNAKEAISDFLAFLQTTDINTYMKDELQSIKTKILSTYPKYFKNYPSEIEKLSSKMKTIKSTFELPNYKIHSANTSKKLTKEKYETEKEETNIEEVFTCCEKGLSLADFINKLPADHRDNDCMEEDEECCWRCCGEWSFEAHWRGYVKDIVNILSYMNVNGYLDDRKFYQRKLEVEDIIYKEIKHFLKKKYKSICLDQHYVTAGNLMENNDPHDRYAIARLEMKWEFAFRFKMPNLQQKVSSEALFWIGSKKRKLNSRDLCLTSEMSKTIAISVENIFDDRLGNFNKKRYMLAMCSVDRERVDVDGKEAGYERSVYNTLFKMKNDTAVPGIYHACTGEHAQLLCSGFTACIENAAKEFIDFEIEVDISSWYYEYDFEHIRSSFFLTKKSYRTKWTITELYEVEKVLIKAKADFYDTRNDIYVSSMRGYYTVRTGYFHYGFQLRSYCPGLKDALEETIEYAQQVMLEIPKY